MTSALGNFIKTRVGWFLFVWVGSFFFFRRSQETKTQCQDRILSGRGCILKGEKYSPDFMFCFDSRMLKLYTQRSCTRTFSNTLTKSGTLSASTLLRWQQILCRGLPSAIQFSDQQWRQRRKAQDTCCCLITKSRLILVTPWTAARQVSLSFTISQSLLKLMSIELMMPSNRLVLSCPRCLIRLMKPLRKFASFFSTSRSYIIFWKRMEEELE